MSKKPIVILIVVMALMVTVGIVAAQQLPGSGWLSGQQIQNIGSGTATISFTAYLQASTCSVRQPSPNAAKES